MLGKLPAKAAEPAVVRVWVRKSLRLVMMALLACAMKREVVPEHPIPITPSWRATLCRDYCDALPQSADLAGQRVTQYHDISHTCSQRSKKFHAIHACAALKTTPRQAILPVRQKQMAK
jgi:hypothetical protein